MDKNLFLASFLQWSIDEAKEFFTSCAQSALSSHQEHQLSGEEPESLIQINEVCQIFNISKPTVHEWKRSGKIPFYRIGRRVYFKRSEVINALQNPKGRRFGK